MKKDQKNKINQMSVAELGKELAKESQELTGLMVNKNLAKLKNVHQIGESKRKIALIKTIINQKKLSKTND